MTRQQDRSRIAERKHIYRLLNGVWRRMVAWRNKEFPAECVTYPKNMPFNIVDARRVK